MSWHETKPGHYSRPFDTSEHMYLGVAASAAHLPGKQHWLVSSALQLKASFSAAEIQHAWVALRHKHPHIAAVADDSGSNFEYTVPSSDALDKWVRETLIIHSSESETRPAETVEVDLVPTHLFTLHYLPYTRELLFRAPHWRTDARGMILLQDEYLKLLVAGSTPCVFDGSEASRLAPPFDQVAKLSYEMTPEMDQSSNAVLGVLAGSMPVSIRDCLPATTPTKSRRVVIQLSQSMTKQIISASKARNQTVTTTVHAALIIASRGHVDPGNGRLNFFAPFDLRDHLPAPWNGAAGCANLFHTGKPWSIDLAQHADFDAIASHLSEFYRRDTLQPMFGHMVDYHRKIAGFLGAPLHAALSAPGAARPDLSSLGVIDDILQRRYSGPGVEAEVQEWWLGVQIMTNLLQMYLWTWDGRIYLGCHYNEAFYEAEFVRGFVEEWRAALVRELLQ